MFSLLAAATYFSLASGGEKYDPTPELTFVGFDNDSVFHLERELILSINYFDGDGDLGENNSDINNLFVTDSRNEVTYKFRIQQLRDDKYTCAVEGQLEVAIPKPSIIDPNADTETVSYSIYATDRSGKQSKPVQTEAITIYR